MAILLIKDRDASHSNPTKNAACYKLGDIVEVFDDSKPIVIPPAAPFWIVKVTNLTAEEARAYLETVRNGSTITHRRRFKIDTSKIPAAARDILLANRYIEVTKAQVKNYILDKTL